MVWSLICNKNMKCQPFVDSYYFRYLISFTTLKYSLYLYLYWVQHIDLLLLTKFLSYDLTNINVSNFAFLKFLYKQNYLYFAYGNFCKKEYVHSWLLNLLKLFIFIFINLANKSSWKERMISILLMQTSINKNISILT